MRLRGKRRQDHSGGDLGKRLKQMAPRLPIFCNSAIDVRKEFPFFEKYFIKGSSSAHDDIYQNIPNIVQSAAAYENIRFAEVPEFLVQLKNKYQISDADFFELIGSRRLPELERTALLLFHRALEEAEGSTLDEVRSSDAGSAEVFFVQPGSREAQGLQLKKAVPIVIERTADVWVAELFGFPLIYTYAEEREDAIHNLLHILHEYRGTVAEQFSLGTHASDYIRALTALDGRRRRGFSNRFIEQRPRETFRPQYR